MRTLSHEFHTAAPDDYLDLVRAFPLRSIRTDHEKAEAIKVLTRLLGRPGGRLTAGERDYVDVLGRLVEDYGQRQMPLVRQKQSPLEIVRFLMRQNSMNTADLGQVLGNKTAASLVLNGKRELSKAHIRKLSARFHVDPGLFF